MVTSPTEWNKMEYILMKKRQTLTAAFAALTLFTALFPMGPAKAGNLPEKTATPMDSSRLSDEAPITELAAVTPEEPTAPVPGETPTFRAYIEYTPHGYDVKGILTGIPPNIKQIQTLCSLDGETYPFYDLDWDLDSLELGGNKACSKKQTILFSSDEPLKSYLEGNLSCFWLKLRLTEDNGTTYETPATAICRGTPQPIPAGTTPIAGFASNLAVRELRPYRYYGKYQLTIREDATPGEVSSFLPDTLPIEIKLLSENLASTAIGMVDCPVTWKPLALPQLTAGESITILDAAEEIVVPSGTFLNTPMGIYQLDEPLGINQYKLTDEVRLVLNVIGKDENPTGALVNQNDGLYLSFPFKPTGATAIRAYICPEGGSEWTGLPDVSLQEATNAQPSTKNSGYALVLPNECEPYRSYLAAKGAGEEPTPFSIGLKIEGGTYDGRQLFLTWPDTYQLPPSLPALSGSGGNEGNAGAGNKGDSTAEGQRPNLPQDSGNQPQDTEQAQKDQPQDSGNQPLNTEQVQKSQPQDTEQAQKSQPQGSQNKPENLLQDNQGKPEGQPQDNQDNPGNLPQDTPQGSQGKPGNLPQNTPQDTTGKPGSPLPNLPQNTENSTAGQPSGKPQDTGPNPNGQLPSIPQNTDIKPTCLLPDSHLPKAPEKTEGTAQNAANIRNLPYSNGHKPWQAGTPTDGSLGLSAQIPALPQGIIGMDSKGASMAKLLTGSEGTSTFAETARPENLPEKEQAPASPAPSNTMGKQEGLPKARRPWPAALTLAAAIASILFAAALVAAAAKKKG